MLRKKINVDNRLSKELNLTEDQQQKIKSMDEENQLKMNELKEQHHLAINNILTPEQQTKFKELREKRDKGKRRRQIDGQTR